MRLVVLLSALAMASISSYADIVNGGFESNSLTGWSVGGTIGNVQVLASGDFAANGSGGSPSIAAPFGNYYALLSNGPGDQGGFPLDSSTLTSIPYLVGAGGSVSFVLDFFTNEFSTSNGGNPDFYAVSILLGGVSVATMASGNVDGAQTAIAGIDCASTFLVAPDGTTVCSHSGLQSINNFDLSPYAGSAVQFQFLVSDAVDNSVDSALLLDGVTGTGLTPFTPVPEPHSWIMLLGALILLYVSLRRRAQPRQPFRG
jgi:hypothetical protein